VECDPENKKIKQQKIAVVRVLWPRDELVSQAGHVAQNMRIKKKSNKKAQFYYGQPTPKQNKSQQKTKKKAAKRL